MDPNPSSRLSASEALDHPCFLPHSPGIKKIIEEACLDEVEEYSTNLKEFHEKYNFGIKPFPQEHTPEILKSPNINKLFEDNFSNPATPEIKMANRGKAVSSYYQNQLNAMKKMENEKDSVIEEDADYKKDMDENSPVVFNIQRMNNLQTMNPDKLPMIKGGDKKEVPVTAPGKTKADLARRNLMKLQ